MCGCKKPHAVSRRSRDDCTASGERRAAAAGGGPRRPDGDGQTTSSRTAGAGGAAGEAARAAERRGVYLWGCLCVVCVFSSPKINHIDIGIIYLFKFQTTQTKKHTTPPLYHRTL